MSDWRMDGRTCLVTGATSGIGFETAADLARRGALVILAGRNDRKLSQALRQIRERHPAARVEGQRVDLASQASIRAFAGRVLAAHPTLHVLVNNAAIVTRRRETTPDGFETQWAVNHLAPFLLTHLLLGALRAGAPARVVNVASQVERDGVIDFDDLQGERNYDHYTAYRQTKLANVLFTFELAKRLAGSGVTANCLHPGVVGTNLLNALYDRPAMLAFLTKRDQPGPATAIATTIRLSCDPSLPDVSGRYFRDEQPSEPSAGARDAAVQARLWQVSAGQVGLAGAA